ncbi:peptide deformylase [Legionella dresdenensis]|uniref:Peptide deformylase n=1 Tax=Legionella dresdenensis TaxID=450200 RepID=A0ABV8CFT1_9GAMM
MKISAQNIFKAFEDKVLDLTYYPTQPLETLKVRLTAVWLLQQPDLALIEYAEALINRTSHSKEVDLLWMKEFSSQIKSWGNLNICSTYNNPAGTFLEYKLSFTALDGNKKSLHFHALYEIRDKRCYFVSQAQPVIRVIGDPILHQPGIPFPEDATAEQHLELSGQIEHAKSVLIQAGGAGIAANQCAAIARPFRFAIVGVFYDSPEHVSGVEKRYPGTTFPAAVIMVNPIIISVSQETQNFNHACLSVPCPNRCAVKSPVEISVAYQDPAKNMQSQQVTLKGVDAVVLWHELTHILDGKTYMDVTFENLPLDDLAQFQKMVDEELYKRQKEEFTYLPQLTVPPFYFSVKMEQNGTTKLDINELANVLPRMAEETLDGLRTQANRLLKNEKKQEGALKGLLRLSIHANSQSIPESNVQIVSDIRACF